MPQMFSDVEVLGYNVDLWAEQLREQKDCRTRCVSLEERLRGIQRTRGQSEATELELDEHRTRLAELDRLLEDALGEVLEIMKRSYTTLSQELKEHQTHSREIDERIEGHNCGTGEMKEELRAGLLVLQSQVLRYEGKEAELERYRTQSEELIQSIENGKGDMVKVEEDVRALKTQLQESTRKQAELEHYHTRSAELMQLIEDGKTEVADVKEQLRALQFQYTEYARQQPLLDPTLIQHPTIEPNQASSVQLTASSLLGSALFGTVMAIGAGLVCYSRTEDGAAILYTLVTGENPPIYLGPGPGWFGW